MELFRIKTCEIELNEWLTNIFEILWWDLFLGLRFLTAKRNCETTSLVGTDDVVSVKNFARTRKFMP